MIYYIALINWIMVICLLVVVIIQRNETQFVKRKLLKALYILQNITRKTMSPTSQAEFDAQIERANQSLTDIANAITAEAQQVSEYINSHPGIDTSALQGVVDRLGTVAESVSGVFTPPETPEAETGA